VSETFIQLCERIRDEHPGMSADQVCALAAERDPATYARLAREPEPRAMGERIRVPGLPHPWDDDTPSVVVPFPTRQVSTVDTWAHGTHVSHGPAKVSPYLLDPSVRPGGPWMRWIPETAKWTFIPLDEREAASVRAGVDLQQRMALAEVRRRRQLQPMSTDAAMAAERQYREWWYARHPPPPTARYLDDGDDAA
jgi:hypothetical protein